MSIIKTLRERNEPLSVSELAKLMDVTEATVQRWVRKRQIPSIRVGDIIRFDPSMLADGFELQNIGHLLRMESMRQMRRAEEPPDFVLTKEELEGTPNRPAPAEKHDQK